MMRKGRILVSILAMAVLAVLLGSCITDPMMSYQGKLTDPAGNPVADGNYNMHFRLWGTSILPPFNPIVVWEETQSVAVTDGLFNVALGSVTPLTPSLFVQPLDLGIEVNGDGEMAPRQPLYGAPYAMTLIDGAVMGGTNIELTEDAPGMLNISNLGTGYGVALQSYGKAGVAVDGADVGNYGYMADNVDHGAIITNTGGTGVYVEASGGSANNWWALAGMHSHDGGDGVFGWATGTGDASTGATVRSDEGRGVYAWTNGAGQNAGYFDGPIWVNGGCTGCVFRYLGRNAGSGTLQSGDAVSVAGVETGLQGMQTPVFKVAPAQADQAVLGVVVGRTTMTMADGSLDDVKAGAQFGPVEGAAAPGDYLVIVVQGPAQVKAASGASIAAGSLVYLGNNGVTTAASGPAIGMALDQVDADGLVWVLVGFH
jgi:hypothetical protein